MLGRGFLFVMLTRLRLSQTARPVEVIRYWHSENAMELNAPYQRGDVWGEVRQRNLIRSILLGIPIPSIIINDRATAVAHAAQGCKDKSAGTLDSECYEGSGGW